MLTPEDHPQELRRLKTVVDLDIDNAQSEVAFQAIAKLLAQAVDVPIALFSVVTGHEQVFKANVGLNATSTSRDISFCGHALHVEDLLVIEDARSDERFKDNPLVTGEPNIRFYAGAVVRAPNKLPVGTVCIIDHRPRLMTKEQLELLLDARCLVEEALKLRIEAELDPLTGLNNRRAFDIACEREWRRAIRHLAPLTVMLIDVDHFKSYNDNLGHPAGDETLCRIAEALAKVPRRPGDMLARYGGEEFVLVLAETPLGGAYRVASRLLRAIEELAIPHPSAAGGKISVSIGASILEGNEGAEVTIDRLVQAADEALYAAKAQGRDRAVVLPIERSGEELLPEDVITI